MFVVFYNADLYIFVFMTCSTPCCLYDTLMDPWNVCMMYVSMYVCMYVYVYVCMYVYTYQTLRAEGVFDAAMILSLVREVN
jgi:hypothetical protein